MDNKGNCYIGLKRYEGESIYIFANGKEIEVKINKGGTRQIALLVIAPRDVIVARSKEMLDSMKEKYTTEVAHV